MSAAPTPTRPASEEQRIKAARAAVSFFKVKEKIQKLACEEDYRRAKAVHDGFAGYLISQGISDTDFCWAVLSISSCLEGGRA